jgi:hypothetical protein
MRVRPDAGRLGAMLGGGVKGGYGEWLLARDARDDAKIWS